MTRGRSSGGSRGRPPDPPRHAGPAGAGRGPPPWARSDRSQSRRREGPGQGRTGGDRPERGGAERAGLDPELHVVGRHAVESVLRHQPRRSQRLWLQEGTSSASALEPMARALQIPVDVVPGDVLDGLAGRGTVHQGVVLACGPFPYADIEELVEAPPLTLVLDGVEDPRNLGAAVRAAVALGADLVVVPRDRAAACTASAHKAAAGALSQIPVARVGNLKRGLELLKHKGAWVVGAEADGAQAPWQVELTGKVVLVVGGEDRGLRRLTREACDHVVSIPMAGEGMSLNAADAATVLLYEALRQRARAPQKA